MATQQDEALIELYRRGELSEPQRAAVEELGRRNEWNLGTAATPRVEGDVRSQLMQEMAEEVGPIEAMLIGTGKGFMTVGRGMGLVDKAGPIEAEAMEALREERPYTTGAGELLGEAAPFIPAAVATGGIAGLGMRLGASGLVSGAEGAIIASGTDQDVAKGASIGAGIGVGAEMLFPVIGRMGRKIFQKVTGKLPAGAMLDATGQPTAELSEALQAAGISFEDLSQDAMEVITAAKPGTDPTQLARKAGFAQEGVPATTGEIGQDFAQQSVEQQLLESAGDTAAEPFRQFKLKQSESIKKSLQGVFGEGTGKEETGNLIHDALIGKKKFLRTKKNELYEQAASATAKLSKKIEAPDDSVFAGYDEIVNDFWGIGADIEETIVPKLYDVDEPLATRIVKGYKPPKSPWSNEKVIFVGDDVGFKDAITEVKSDKITKMYEQSDFNEEAMLVNVGGEEFDALRLTSDGGFETYLFKSKDYDRLTRAYPEIELITKEGDSFVTPKRLAAVPNEIPVFIDNITDAVVDADTMEDLAITAPQAMKSLDQILTKYGMKEPAEDVAEDFVATPLTLSNFERFRKTLNAIERGDTTGAASIAIRPIKEALDIELDELGDALAKHGYGDEIVKPLKMARKTVRQLKTEFSPQSVIGQIVGTKKDGVTQITEASKVYDKMLAKSQPVESVRKLMLSLKSAPNGQQAAASIQATTMLDLIDAGFSTESRQISGVRTFNPIAFKNRIKAIGKPKLQAIFAGNKEALRKINNIDEIAASLIPPSGATPKGSASVILDLANQLGFASISAKVPLLGPVVAGAIKGITAPIKTGAAVKKAVAGAPDVEAFRSLIDRQFPGIASAIAIPATVDSQEEK